MPKKGASKRIRALRATPLEYKRTLGIRERERGTPGAGMLCGKVGAIVGMGICKPDEQAVVGKPICDTLNLLSQLNTHRTGIVMHLDDCGCTLPTGGLRGMGYRMLKIDPLYEVYRPVVAGESKRPISIQTGWDHKTIGKYVGILTDRTLLPADTPLAPEESQTRAADLADQPREKSTPARDQLLDHLDGLRELIAPPKDERGRSQKPMREESAYRVILRRQNLSIGYTSRKRFARDRGLMDVAKKAYVRIELLPGREVQLDCGSMGLMAVDGQNRAIYAFCRILSHSRKPLVQLVSSQNEQSFAESVVEMLHFYGESRSFSR